MTEVPLHRWVHGKLPAEVEEALGRLRSAEDVVKVAVMPDVHLASEVCVGVALATRERLIPAAVGSDIGCGMAAVAFDCEADRVEPSARAILRRLARVVPVLRHRSREGPELPESLAEDELSDGALEHAKAREGALQLGSLGRGNHFVELQRDDEGRLWAMVHSGSRGIGQRIRRHHEAGGTPDAVGLRGFSAESERGRAYLHDLDWARRYARHNRERILARLSEVLAEVLGTTPVGDSLVCCDHNHVSREEHPGGELWVHRKGAISARAGEPGIIPGSMGSPSYLVAGRGHPESLCSSSHGAGRAMSRSEARRRISLRQLERELRGICFDARIADRLRDEAPGAYKDIGAVMKAQRALTRIVRRLRPVLAFKGA